MGYGLSHTNYKQSLAEIRSKGKVDHHGLYKVKRFTVHVNGMDIDAMIYCKPAALKERKWILFTGGNSAGYEMFCENAALLSNKLNANVVVFNYPCVGASSGSLTKKSLGEAYRAMLRVLEDDIHGIGAKTIIGIGHSIGGAAQAEGLKSHSLKRGIRYVFVKDRTFNNLPQTAYRMVYGSDEYARNRGFLYRSLLKIVGFITYYSVKLAGWNIDIAKASKNLKAPEIVIQTITNSNSHERRYSNDPTVYKVIIDSRELICDGLFEVDSTLAKTLLEEPSYKEKENKLVVGTLKDHFPFTETTPFLTQKINALALL